MAFPALDKTWQIASNLGCYASSVDGTATDSYQMYFYKLKNALCTFASNPWTVVSSCGYDYTTPPTRAWQTGAVDYWNDQRCIGRQSEGVNHSWIVLKQTGVAANFQVLINNGNVDGRYASMLVSPSVGFTGGTTTNRPTASDEVAIVNSPSTNWDWMPYNVAVFGNPCWLHVWQSSDGQVTRAVLYENQDCYEWIDIGKPKNPYSSGWIDEWYAVVASSAWDYLTKYSGGGGGNRYKSTGITLYLTGEMWVNNWGGLRIPQPDNLLANSPLNAYPVGLMSMDFPYRGVKGELYDLWWGISGGDKTIYPNDGSRAFVQLIDLILPWDGSLMRTG